MEVTTQVPQTGTKLRIDADRQFEGQAGDSVLRVQGQSPDGGQVFDAAYVEVDAQEAQAIGMLVRNLRQPTPELQDAIAQDVLAPFTAKLSGKDAAQIAHIVTKAWWDQLASYLGPQGEREQRIERLAERFDRAAAKRKQPFGASTEEGNGQQQKQSNR